VGCTDALWLVVSALACAVARVVVAAAGSVQCVALCLPEPGASSGLSILHPTVHKDSKHLMIQGTHARMQLGYRLPQFLLSPSLSAQGTSRRHPNPSTLVCSLHQKLVKSIAIAFSCLMCFQFCWYGLIFRSLLLLSSRSVRPLMTDMRRQRATTCAEAPTAHMMCRAARRPRARLPVRPPETGSQACAPYHRRRPWRASCEILHQASRAALGECGRGHPRPTGRTWSSRGAGGVPARRSR
jgi:hypothetical protein